MAGPSWNDGDVPVIRDQRIWSIKECAEILKKTIDVLKARFTALQHNKDEPQFLVWDKVS